MFKVEYLLLLESDKAKCKTVKALKSLLGTDSDIEIDKDKISYKGFSTSISIKLGKKDETSHLFFNIVLSCNAESEIDKFSGLLKAIRGAVSLVSKTNYVIWDDLSLFYSQKAYPIIFNIENLMRQLITKFMLTNIGAGWTKDRVPTDVQQSINSSNKDINYLNNVDFIQLKNFLFSENYPSHKENLIQKLKNAKDLSSLNLDEIKTLLPESNWDKYFKPFVGFDAEALKKRWDKLYELRCSVAHNKPFAKSDLEEVEVLSSELKSYLDKALTGLDKIVIAETERESLVENVVIGFGEAYGRFIIKFRQLEALVGKLYNQANPIEEGRKKAAFSMQIRSLHENGIIDNRQFNLIASVYYIRNVIVHNADSAITAMEIRGHENIIEEFILLFTDMLDRDGIK